MAANAQNTNIPIHLEYTLTVSFPSGLGHRGHRGHWGHWGHWASERCMLNRFAFADACQGSQHCRCLSGLYLAETSGSGDSRFSSGHCTGKPDQGSYYRSKHGLGWPGYRVIVDGSAHPSSYSAATSLKSQVPSPLRGSAARVSEPLSEVKLTSAGASDRIRYTPLRSPYACRTGRAEIKSPGIGLGF